MSWFETLLADANSKGALVRLTERDDGLWDCVLHARVNRMYYVAYVLPTAEAALTLCLEQWELKVLRDGPPVRPISIDKKKLDIDELLAGL